MMDKLGSFKKYFRIYSFVLQICKRLYNKKGIKCFTKASCHKVIN